ncbi:MAG: acetolactate synthase, large subunit, biosynthetic type, partial [Oscillospiraceae bacterium]|nr:acetolactate synthase, large subunit, biosynthetic type [Oscillospiraceae bacterium]
EGRFLTTGGMGTMGYSIPAAMGAKLARPTRDVVAVCGDGSFQMNLTELGTIMQNHINVKIIVMRNNRLGMVRELQSKLYESRYSATILEDPDFIKIADAYGIKSAEVNSNEEAEKIAEHMFKTKEPFILVCNVYPNTPSI